MSWLVSVLLVFLIISGSVFSLLAAVGINRLPDVYSRMHAASKAGTIGSGILLLAAGIYSHDISIVARALAGFLFFILTAPVAAHLLAKAFYAAGYRMSHVSVVDEMK